MKKFIVALAAVAMAAGMGIQAQVCGNAQNCPRAQQCPQQCDSICMAPCPRQQCAFENLNLTDTQKQQLKALCEKQKKSKKEDKADRKADRQAAKQARLAEIKKILTPEQYVLFLENSFVNGRSAKKFDCAFKPGARGGRQFCKEAPRCARQAVPAEKMRPAKKMESVRK